MSECKHYLTTSLADYEHKRVSCKWCIKCGKSDGEIELQAEVERLKRLTGEVTELADEWREMYERQKLISNKLEVMLREVIEHGKAEGENDE